MPERHRPFARPRAVLLTLSLVLALGDPHGPLAVRAPAVRPAPAAETAAAERAAPRPRAPRDRCARSARRRWGVVPRPRCHWD
ncbi:MULTISPECIES: hypothetical protein [unclassified Nocardiopsis]|uniref:hypothetical protein n=1 Tax=unclassified Nocardiopsis TaxID=2649073 RepID=UPI0013573F45|nr:MULTISPECIES: hypothetical protein [unclassified Nocardiopsis]